MLHNLGLTIVAWNLDSNDWQDSTQIVSLIKERADNGDSGVVSLQHDIDAKVVAQIPKSIEAIVNGKAGYKAMPVSTCLGQKAYDEGFWTRLGAAPPSGSAASSPAEAPASAPATSAATVTSAAPASDSAATKAATATAQASGTATAHSTKGSTQKSTYDADGSPILSSASSITTWTGICVVAALTIISSVF